MPRGKAMAMYVIVGSEMRVWRRGHSKYDTLLSQNFPTHVTACDGTPMKGSVTAHPWPHRATFKTSRYDCLSCFAWPLLTRRRRDTKSKESGLSFVLSRYFCRPELAYQAFFIRTQLRMRFQDSFADDNHRSTSLCDYAIAVC